MLAFLASLGPWGQAVANFFGYQTAKMQIAQSKPLVDAKTQQADQVEIDREERVVDQALHETDPKKRQQALEEEQRLAAE